MITDYMTKSQLITITGARGTGKTTLAYTFMPPKLIGQVYAHDSERSANRIIKNLADYNMEIGHYTNLGSRFKDLDSDDLLSLINRGELPWVSKERKSSLIGYYEFVIDDIAKNLTPNKYKVYIHDTIEKLEAGMAAWVDDNHRRSGVKTTAYGKLWTEGVYPLYENLIESIYDRGVETIIFTSHLKNPWQGNRPIVGKVAPSGKKLLYRLSALMLWLVNDGYGAPAGLVLKERMGSLRVSESGLWEIKRMLPERIPNCTWENISNYLENGYNVENPDPKEVMSASEKELISELLTDAQMQLMILTEQQALAEMTQPLITTNTIDVSEQAEKPAGYNDSIKDAIASGKSNSEIVQELNVPLPHVIKARRELEA